MRVIGLVSGGKDSVYSLMEAVRLGHTVVALGNLYPASIAGADGPGDTELDSFMFQSVGHNVAAALSAAMGVPLFRIATRGRAIQSSVAYVTPAGSTGATGEAGDEVEDLFTLLSAIKAAFPDADAVSSGAILSNYQRTRVENV